MAHLPPVTWNEVATKDDLERTQSVLRSEIQQMATALRGEMQVGFADMRTELVRTTNRQIIWIVTFATAWSAILVAAVRLMA